MWICVKIILYLKRNIFFKEIDEDLSFLKMNHCFKGKMFNKQYDQGPMSTWRMNGKWNLFICDLTALE